MDFLNWGLEHFIEFGIASIPLTTYFLCKKEFKLAPKITLILLILHLLSSIYFWFKLKDDFLIVYQIVPYVSSFICVWCDQIQIKRNENNKSEADLYDENNIY